jgi:hypothetical protein
MKFTHHVFGAEQLRVTVAKRLSALLLLTTGAYLVGVDSVVSVSLSVIGVLFASAVMAVYSGYIDGGVVCSFGAVAVSILWIQLVPPVAALVVGPANVVWCETPWPLPIRFTVVARRNPTALAVG